MEESAFGIDYSRVPNHWRQSPLWGQMVMYDDPEDTTRLAFMLIRRSINRRSAGVNPAFPSCPPKL